jgi:hypothetical protein
MKNPAAVSIQRGDEWPETVYRYVEHYKWEPQHLCRGKSTKTFHDKIRKQEPPLNFLLNMLFVAMPESWMSTVLGSMSVSPKVATPHGLVQRFPVEISKCQPDVRLESDTHRVFIECKIDAYSDSTQMLKYLLLSAYLDKHETPKEPWILYLSSESMATHWNLASERVTLKFGGTDALRSILSTADLSVLGTGKMAREFKARVEFLRSKVVVGHATWQQFGSKLQLCAAIEKPSDLEKPLCRMANDFLVDLRQRQLWTPGV